MKEWYDVTIIGGGPAGLYSAFYSGLRGMKTKIIEYQQNLGGKVLLYPEKMIWDVGGQLPVLGEKFAKQIVQQGLTFDPTVCRNTKVESVEKDANNNFILTTNDGKKHYSRAVILANGGGIIQPKRLDVTDAQRYEGKNLHYSMKSLKSLQNKTVLISGGGDAAIDCAVELLEIAKKVIVVYRKNECRAHEAQVNKLVKGNAKFMMNTTIDSFIGTKDGTAIQQVLLKNNASGIRSNHEVDHVIVQHGYNRESSFTVDPNITLEKKDDYFYKGDSFGCTTENGIFAAGDILTYDGKINLLVGAFQDAVQAVNSVKNYLEPTAPKVGMVSSHHKAFEERNKEIIHSQLNA
ncbi:NAD(P)/FAD-dependent oxidoreductase [Oceanobacillus senegalensis]|uniref:NAD(P)/FAD-dependent oxidoreductase n=1 Tax=Oceanobacillus senegalensis TaxID=1936063 RepID=UPI000A306140|nr:NAD(P)/FAD-dependent oxidoreductase [Oceanobacillus senegalensis]